LLKKRKRNSSVSATVPEVGWSEGNNRKKTGMYSSPKKALRTDGKSVGGKWGLWQRKGGLRVPRKMGQGGNATQPPKKLKTAESAESRGSPIEFPTGWGNNQGKGRSGVTRKETFSISRLKK